MTDAAPAKRRGHPSYHGSEKGTRLGKRSAMTRLKISKKAPGTRTMANGSVRSDKDVAKLFDAKAELKKHSPAAIRKLVALLNSRDERVAFAAAREILDRNLGKPAVLEAENIGAVTITWRSPDDANPHPLDARQQAQADWDRSMNEAAQQYLPRHGDDTEDLETDLEN